MPRPVGKDHCRTGTQRGLTITYPEPHWWFGQHNVHSEETRTMIFDHRTYTARPNMLPSFLKLYEDVGLPMQRHYLGEPFGFFQTHIGDLSRTVHLWKYDSLADREARRDAMEVDPEWQAYRRKVIETDYLADMRNQILKPVSFFNPVK
jgi:hypothetical protein